MRLKKERHGLAFILYEHIFSFMVDIQPGCEYPSDERNKPFSYYYY